MPDSPPPKMPEVALTTVEDEKRLLERQRLRTERKELRKRERLSHLENLVARVKSDAAEHVALKRHMFKTDEELDAVVPRLTQQQRRIIRQWEEPKKATAFGVESSAKLIEAETRARADKGGVKINIENAVLRLPEKEDETVAPVYIDVIPEDRK